MSMRSMEISSPANPRVKQWAQLLDKKGRDKQNKFMVEGVHLVQEAILSGAEIDTLVYSREKGLPAELKDLPLDRVEQIAVSHDILLKCSDTIHPQGIFAVLPKLDGHIESLLRNPAALVVAVDGVQDPGNLGTIIRSADAVGATGVIVGKGSVDLYNPKTVRSTMGSLFHLPILECDLTEILSGFPQGHDLQVLNTSLQAEQNCYELDLKRPTWIVVGNEGQGVSAEVSQYVTRHTKIPMAGKAESLNVAMAATVLLYEALRQREFSISDHSSNTLKTGKHSS